MVAGPRGISSGPAGRPGCDLKEEADEHHADYKVAIAPVLSRLAFVKSSSPAGERMAPPQDPKVIGWSNVVRFA